MKVYLAIGEEGQYSDCGWWRVGIYSTLELAKIAVKKDVNERYNESTGWLDTAEHLSEEDKEFYRSNQIKWQHDDKWDVPENTYETDIKTVAHVSINEEVDYYIEEYEVQ